MPPDVTKGLVNRLANRTLPRAASYSSPIIVAAAHSFLLAYWVELGVQSDYLPYTLPMTIAGSAILLSALAVTVYVALFW